MLPSGSSNSYCSSEAEELSRSLSARRKARPKSYTIGLQGAKLSGMFARLARLTCLLCARGFSGTDAAIESSVNWHCLLYLGAQIVGAFIIPRWIDAKSRWLRRGIPTLICALAVRPKNSSF